MGIQRFKGQGTSTHPSDETRSGQIIQNPSDGYVSGAHHPRQVGYSDYALSKKCVEDQLSSLRREPSCRRGSFGKDLSAGFFPVLLCSPLLVQTTLVSMVLLVEYPRMRIRKVLVNGLLLSVRRWYMLVLSLAVLAGYSWGADALAHPSGSSGHWTDLVYGLGRCEVAGRTFRPADGP